MHTVLCKPLAVGLVLIAASKVAAHPCDGAAAAAQSRPSSGTPCWAAAAKRYGVPENLLRAIAHVESRFTAHAVRAPYAAGNRDGSCDFGMLQINSAWLPTLARAGISRDDLFDSCTNIQVGAWILSGLIRHHGMTWEAVGAYNAGCARLTAERCSSLRARYAWRVHDALATLRREHP
ncbi:MAG: lytic transglycosylase domain-containing protein [Rhodocyclaceae bacterium]|nr:lytic transglycosylase domain-containing protein [Rhodocyclaceae bacterium]MBX3669855.1 lytic transglycosylase domain-containing protein [Rhodocyclaceae bacterium]